MLKHFSISAIIILANGVSLTMNGIFMVKRATQKDIQEATGLSATAVSQVLAGKPCRISAHNKQLILDAAKALNYRPNKMAQSLAKRHSEMFGLIIPDIENPFFASLAKAIEDRLQARGFSLFIASTHEEGALDELLLQRLDSMGVEGLFYVPSLGHADLSATLQQLRAPLLLIDRPLEEGALDLISTDHATGGALAARYLLEQGHSNVCALVNTHGPVSARARVEGFVKTMAEAGHKLGPEQLIECSYSFDAGYQALTAVQAQGATAVFSSSDLMSVGLLQALTDKNLHAPADLSVISYDYTRLTQQYLPHLSAIAQDLDALADAALERMWQYLEGTALAPYAGEKNTAATNIVVAPHLHPGSTVAPRTNI